MARLSLNVDQETLDGAGRQFEPVPAGPYTVTIFSITEDKVKEGDNKGKLRLKFQFRIADGETAPDGSKQGNRRLFADVNAFEGVSQKTGEPTPPYDLLAIAKALGVAAEDLADIDTDDWLGEELQVTVGHKKKQTQDPTTKKWVDANPVEFKEVIRGYRSLASVATSVAASAAVAGKAPSAVAGKAKAAGSKFKL
jgi:hypothetical protein